MNAPRTLLFHYLRPRWQLSALLSLALLATVALNLTGPQILRAFIDGALRKAALDHLILLAALFLAVALATQVFSVLETYLAENLGLLATNHLRTDLLVHVLRLDLSFHRNHTPGELIERIDGDVFTLANFFSRFVVYILGNALLVAGVLVMLFRVDPRVGAALTLYTLVSVGIVLRLRNLAVPHYVAARQASADLIGFIEERLDGTEDIRSSGAVPYVMRRLHEHSRALLRTTQRAIIRAGFANGTTTLLFTTGMAVALGIGGYLFSLGAITIGSVYLIFSYTQMLENPIQMINRQLQDFQQAAASVRRVQVLLAIKSEIADGSVERLPAGSLSVQIEEVTFAYEEEPALRDLSLTLRSGTVLGVLGRTGSGKTTLARLLCRLYDPQTGAVRVGGTDLRNLKLSALHGRVGMVTQDIQLFHASVRDNLTFFDRSVSDERIWEVLKDLGLDAWCRSLSHRLDTILASGTLSAGEAQLLAFARVFLVDPGLVVLDEASSRLDPATERRLERAVDRLLEGRTAIIIAHRLATVQRADDILILENGSIREYGSRELLERNPASHFSRLLRTGMEEALA